MAQKFFKRSYEDALRSVIPQVYFDNAVENASTSIALEDSLVNSVINFCVNQPSVLGISATPGEFSAINTLSGISKWFVPQNDRAFEITAKEIEVNILHKLNLCTGSLAGSPCTWARDASAVNIFSLSGNIESKLLSLFKDTLLPKITLNSNSLAETTASAFANDASGTHDYLINNLGWLYFLNTSGAHHDPSSYVASALTDVYVSSIPFTVQGGVKGVLDHVWRNWSSTSSISSGMIPTNYYSGTGEYVSSTQNLDKLKTLIEVVYDQGPITEDDTYVYNAFVDYIDNGNVLESRESTGQFTKFIKGASYSIFDTNKNAQLMQYLYDLDKCPDNLLKYLAELIGWTLRGSSPEGWRRQLRFAVKLYKQKGTKEGLYNAITTVLPGTGFESSSISEFYESYVPYLIYYLLNTDTTVFDSMTSWNPDRAAALTDNEYSYSDMDYNIRVVIDHILLKAVKLFPDLFYVRNFKFDLNNPDFVFEYRDRAFPIPPWEEIKFYKDVDVTDELVNYFKNELLCLGVSQRNADLFYDFVINNTVSSKLVSKYYNNSLLFFTSGLNRAPNEQTILDARDYKKYDFLSLWNGKSSHFDVTVSSGSFDTQFFNDLLSTKNDFFQSLSIVDEFTPAKAIPRSHVDLNHSDSLTSDDLTCPSVRYAIHDLLLSGTQAGYESSGVDIRNVAGAVGGDYPTPDNSSRAINNHTNLPVFKRAAIDTSYDPIQLDGSSVSAVPLTNIERSNVRRRDFSKTLKKSGWYTRTGQNMPSYYNVSNQGSSDIDFYSLGFINSQYGYNPVINYKNLYEVSSWPYDNSLWTECWTRSSDYSLCTIPASSTFDIRGRDSISPGSCNSYVRRDRAPEFTNFLYTLRDKQFLAKAEAMYKTNYFLLDTSAFRNPILSIKNNLLNESTLELDDLYSTILGKRIMSRDSWDGMEKTFKDYISYFTSTGIGNGLLDSYKDGGPNVLSHTYGPLLYNGYLRVDGSSIDVSSSLIETAATDSSFTLPSLSSLNNLSANSVDDMYVEYTELRNPYVLSGVELVDVATTSALGSSKFSVYDLDASNASVQRDNYNIGNPLLFLNSTSPFPRLRFNLKDYGPNTNLIIPDRDFKISVQGNFGRTGSLELGGGSFGVWIHTAVETDYNGNKVFWNYMPDGTWSMMDANILQGVGAVNLVKNTLSHVLSFNDTKQLEAADSCFTTQVIGILQEEDFVEKSLNFNTKNQKIKVPYIYYKKEAQVHRTSQNYIVEVFQYDNTLSDTFAIVDYVSIQDLRLSNRAATKYPVEYSDYSKYLDTLSTYKFYTEDGILVSPGEDILLDTSGNMTLAGGNKVTCHISNDLSPEYTSNGILFSQVRAYLRENWVQDSLGTSIGFKEHKYTGIIQIDDSNNILPASITIVGNTKGSNILKKETLYVGINPEDLLIILREFKRLQADEGSRDKTISAAEYGSEGGSRLNYKFAPMWGQAGGYSEFETNARQYTIVNVEN
tara:strand:+ start:12433 stop:16854 length:4422 start_codon:yes stop_codon:yes gene_type:complete